MIQKDAGVLQMESFSSGREEFLALELEEQVDQQLSKLASVSGSSYEKLLVAVMLKEQFQPGKCIQEGEVLADMLGYERLNEDVFLTIASFYERMFGCAEFLPVASVYSSQEGEILYDAKNHVKEAGRWKPGSEETGMEQEETETGGYWLQIPVEEDWQGILPVICMKTGTVIACEKDGNTANILCLETEDGIRMFYGNLADYLKDWQTGDQIESGEILGSAAGLVIQFQLQTEDGSWHSFNGLPCLNHGEKQARPVTQMLQSEYPESH